ncbi:MAG TPA: hypothetical protein VGD40_15295 [Chryseosolibacter sp.]
MSDEELQKQFESNNPPTGSDRDTIAYREIFRVVAKEPSVTLRSNFAESIVRKILAKKKRESRRDMIWLSFGVVFLLIGLIVTAVVAGLKFELGFLREISGLLIFGVAVILLFNWIERRAFSKPSSNT